MKLEYRIISDIITEKSRVLDVGCDDGSLMEFLKGLWLNKPSKLIG